MAQSSRPAGRVLKIPGAHEALRPPESGGPLVSIIVPVYNEIGNLSVLHERLTHHLDQLPYKFEVVWVDDGSMDGSYEELQRLAEGDARSTVVRFTRNFGQTAAIAAGIDFASGQVLVFMDADLQNDPADIGLLLRKIEEGYDVVSGWRVDRKDTFLTRRLPSRMANSIISRVTGVHLHDYGCTLKAYRPEVLAPFRLYGEMHRFLPAYAAQAGARIVEIPVQHHARHRGSSKYGLGRTFKVMLDLMTVKFLNSYATSPIYLFGGLGLGMVFLSFALLAFLVADKLIRGSYLVESPLLLMTVMLFILGSLSVLLGLTTELLVRTYFESQGKSTYVVREVRSRQTREG